MDTGAAMNIPQYPFIPTCPIFGATTARGGAG